MEGVAIEHRNRRTCDLLKLEFRALSRHRAVGQLEVEGVGAFQEPPVHANLPVAAGRLPVAQKALIVYIEHHRAIRLAGGTEFGGSADLTVDEDIAVRSEDGMTEFVFTLALAENA